jgi:predicted ester cyclase
MFCTVARKRLFYSTGADGRCVGAVLLDNIEVRIKEKKVKKQIWFHLQLVGVEKKKSIYWPTGPSGEKLGYARSKARSSHCYMKSADESDVLAWKAVIDEQIALVLSAEDLARDDFSEFTDAGDATAADYSEMSDEDGADDLTDTSAADAAEWVDESATADSSSSPSSSSSSVASGASSSSMSALLLRATSSHPNMQRKGYLEMRDQQIWSKRYFMLDGTHDRNVLTFFRSEKIASFEHDLWGVIEIDRAMKVDVAESAADDDSATRSGRKNKTYGFRLSDPHGRRIFSLTHVDGRKLPTADDHCNAASCVFRAHSEAERADWMQSLLAVVERAPARGHRLGIPSMPADKPPQPIEFFNALMARHWQDMMHSAVFKNDVMRKIRKKVADVRLPKKLGPVTLKELDLGASFIDFRSYRYNCVPTADNQSYETLFELDISYMGGFEIVLATELYIGKGKNVKIPVEARVQLIELTGLLHVYGPPWTADEPGPLWRLFFPEVPTIQWDVSLKAVGKDLSTLPWLKKFIFSQLEKLVNQLATWPSHVTFHIPFPGRKLGLRPVRITSSARPPRDGQRRQVPKGYESTSVVAMKYLIGQYIDVVLNGWELNRIAEFANDNCRVYGINPFYETPYEGYDGMTAAVSELRSGFPDLHFFIVDMSVEGSNVIVRFKARGTHQGPFWDALPTNERTILQGIFITRLVNLGISTQHFYWEPACIFALLG